MRNCIVSCLLVIGLLISGICLQAQTQNKYSQLKCKGTTCAQPVAYGGAETATAKAAIVEAKLKAAYMYKILNKYVELDRKKYKGKYLIGVAGNNNLLRDMLQELSQKANLKGTKMKIENWDPAKNIGDYHALFISNLSERNFSYIMKKVDGEKVVTFTDLPEHKEDGAFVRFETMDNKVKFSIDNEESLGGLGFDKNLWNLSYQGQLTSAKQKP